MICTIQEWELEEKQPTYPCMMRSGESTLIVLFDCWRCGTVISAIDRYSLGTVSRNWDMAQFKPFHGSVTLESD